MIKLPKNVITKVVIVTLFFLQTRNATSQIILNDTYIDQLNPIIVDYNVTASLTKRVEINLSTFSDYGNLSIIENNRIILDNIDISNRGKHKLNVLVKFSKRGKTTLKLLARGGSFTIKNFILKEVKNLAFPVFKDITKSAGIITGPALKYGGPTIADFDNDGDYDLVLNNHNDSINPSKLLWNNGKGVFNTSFKIARWKRQDLHGTSAADFDNDEDLDLIATRGGGNGTKPSPPDFYINTNGKLKLSNEKVGVTAGARGRSAVWGDFDSDNDLDIIFLNEEWNNPNGGRHVIYKNKGNGTFETIRVPNFEDVKGDRFVLTDINGDNIDDFIIYSPISIWQGNGDFTFMNVTNAWLPKDLLKLDNILAATDIDIDNDGDLDIYLSRGKSYYQVANKTVDFNPVTKIMDARDEGNKGRSLINFTASDEIKLSEFETVYRSTYDGDFPVFLGGNKTKFLMKMTDVKEISKNTAKGWPTIRNENGLYIGYIGKGKWKLESVRNSDVYWSIHWTIENVDSMKPMFKLNNKNKQDVLLRNDGSAFVNVSSEWNIPKGGNNWGVTTGDFNNDGFADLFINRFPFLKYRVADYMLLNNGKGSFEITTSHKAANVGNKSHGDMGQAFDYDLDGGVDILEGSDELGTWHLFRNKKRENNNYVIVKVGYSKKDHLDPISAKVIVETKTKTLIKRVGSAGSVYSQSLLNIIHFGLGKDEKINKITIRWRNGETKIFKNKSVNQIIDTY